MSFFSHPQLLLPPRTTNQTCDSIDYETNEERPDAFTNLNHECCHLRALPLTLDLEGCAEENRGNIAQVEYTYIRYQLVTKGPSAPVKSTQPPLVATLWIDRNPHIHQIPPLDLLPWCVASVVLFLFHLVVGWLVICMG